MTDLMPPEPSLRSRSESSTGIRVVPRWWRDTSVVAGWAVLLFVTASWIGDGGIRDLFAGPSDALTSAGRLSGLIASALLLLQVFLMARVPWIERTWGQDELTRLHRVVGFTSFTLMLAHIGLITLGYAAADPSQIWATIVDLTANYPGVLLALAGTLALILVVVTSARAARRRLRYESWHLIHLYAYLGTGLALPHQLWSGEDFLKSTAATVFWWTLYVVCAGSVVLWRIALPLWRSLRANIRVLDVHREPGDVLTVTVAGPGVEHLRAQGGQFFQWRFLNGAGWTEAHPYSLSAAPSDTKLRFTAAIVGDGTAALTTLKPGTRVLVEGPYGRMHPGTRTCAKSLLIGAGIGITPMRALLESLPQRPGDVMVIHRVRTVEDAVLRREIDNLAHERGAEYRIVEGHRIRDRNSWLPQHAQSWDDTGALLYMCPDVAERDVFICGPGPWARAVRRAVKGAGTPDERIHTESFEL
ncbi:ferredoxin reductase family protein [Rhodococcus sp. G-MC3]|uniref:ferredoxin reductase family protein n=1 Tax=Rhodococcus sp. G-MC3 TaxID=3046209 RepID=UPI0024BB1AEB|nr:ferredoxin reductase family protein [Rhodococcus sp. G-MC3]MDJ0392925.1 ferredoxin reductase family protein [Rhodococcus sp. G-MC3]